MAIEIESAHTLPVIIPQDVLSELSSEEKIALLSGSDMWHTAPIKRLGVPRVRVSLARRVHQGKLTFV